MAALSSEIRSQCTVGVDGSSEIGVEQVEGSLVVQNIGLSDSWTDIVSWVEVLACGRREVGLGCGGGCGGNCSFLHFS